VLKTEDGKYYANFDHFSFGKGEFTDDLLHAGLFEKDEATYISEGIKEDSGVETTVIKVKIVEDM